MAHKKRRVFQHVMEDHSYEIIKRSLPQEWVIREFNRPDYGIDLVIELFEKIDEETFETLGEFIYVQVKSTKKVQIKNEKIYPVHNVAKGSWNENRTECMELDLVHYSLDTNSIYTVQTLGASISVLLFLVDLSNEDVYFICLNDYIDKIILPRKPDYTQKASLTIKIPVFNNLKDQNLSLSALNFYGKRAKLLAAFSQFHYQKNELYYLLGLNFSPVSTYRDELEQNRIVTLDDVLDQTLYFINQIEGLDIWKFQEIKRLPILKQQLIKLKAFLLSGNWETKELFENIIQMWHQLTNIGFVYEDLNRESFLPKVISMLQSYPSELVPELKEVDIKL